MGGYENGIRMRGRKGIVGRMERKGYDGGAGVFSRSGRNGYW